MAEYQPKVNSILVITLPGETIRAKVVKIIDRHTCMVELTGQPPNHAKMHTYRAGDFIPVERTRNGGWLSDNWEAMDERLLYARALPGEMPDVAKRKRKSSVRKVGKRIVKEVSHAP